MRYVAAYILAVMGGNANQSAAELSEILGSVGVEVDSAQLDIVIKVRLFCLLILCSVSRDI